MFERLKTAALIVLVGASVYLSFLIWQILPPPVSAGGGTLVGGTFWGPGIDVVDLMKPARVIAHLSKDDHTVFYPETTMFNRAWQPALDALQQLGGRWDEQAKLVPRDEESWQQARHGPCLELVFDFPADLGLWGEILGYESQLATGWPVKRMLLIDKPEPQFMFASSSGDSFASLQLPSTDLDLETFFNQLEARQLVAYSYLDNESEAYWSPFGFLLPEQDLAFPVFEINGQKLDPQVVAGSFFADLTLTRRITERDGATIYSDGRRGVRIWPEGRVDYNAPEVLQGAAFPRGQALQRAIRFVTQHGGWFHAMRLGQLQEVKGRQGQTYYQLAFRPYQLGLPVADYSVQMELSDRGVASYERKASAFRQKGQVKVLSVSVVRAQLSRLIADGEKVSDVYPCYQIKENSGSGFILMPVWVCETISGHQIVLEASDSGGGNQ